MQHGNETGLQTDRARIDSKGLGSQESVRHCYCGPWRIPQTSGRSQVFQWDFIPWLTVAALTNIPDSTLCVTDTAACLTQEGSRYSRTLEKETLIIANSGATLGVAKILGITCCANDGIAALINQSTGNRRFICHYLNTQTKHLREVVATGNGQPNLNTGLIGKILIPFPSLADQRVIVEALDDVNKLIGTLDGVVAKKRDLKHAAMQQLLTGKQRLPGFSDEWDVKRLGDIGSFSKGRGLAKGDLSTSGDLPAVPYTAIYTDHDEIIQILKIRHFTSRARDLEVINSPHVLIAGSSNMLENIGKATAFLGDTNLAVGGDIVLYRTGADVRFLSYLLSTTPHRRRMVLLSQGSTIRHVYASTFQTYQILLPSLIEQSAIAAVLSDMDAEIAAWERRLAKTRALKEGMMQELLTGKTRLT